MTKPAKRAYTLKIQLRDIRPPVWRRLRVAGSLTLGDLHLVIQTAFGWDHSHLHSFYVGDHEYSVLDVMAGMDARDEDAFTLDTVLGARVKKFRYVYDFGDDWEHLITVEKREPPAEAAVEAVCLKGKRACPPEDCGGPWGYGDLLAALKKPESEEDRELVDWVGEEFDPEAFDLDETNERLANLRGY